MARRRKDGKAGKAATAAANPEIEDEIEMHGEIAAAHVDTLLAIAPSRIKSFVDTFEQHTGDEIETIRCESFAEANDWIAENAKSGDVVLLENDLPDLYERRLGI